MDIQTLEQDPLSVSVEGRSADAVVRDVISQAKSRGKVDEVAKHLVGAKLKLRFGGEFSLHHQKVDRRKSNTDTNTSGGYFEVANTVIIIAMTTLGENCLSQIADALDDRNSEVWLLTGFDRVECWKNEIAHLEDINKNRVVVKSVESFIGQSISEIGGFSNDSKRRTLIELFELYNHRWVAKLGSNAIRIEVK